MTIAVLANDTGGGAPLAITAVTQGAHGSVTIQGTSVLYTPVADYFGSDSFSYTASDGTTSDSATVDLTITPVNDEPVAADDQATTAQGTAVAVAVLANDTDVENDPLTVSAVTQGGNGTVTTNGTAVTYTPGAEFAGGDTFTYTVSDGAATATATVSVTVTDSTAPVITPNINGTLGLDGWYVSNVGVTWTVADNGSPITSQVGCGPVSLTIDTAGQTLTCTAISAGGTSSQSLTLKRDATIPLVSLLTPANGATYDQHTTVNANYSCSDSLAGLTSCAGTVANATPIDTATTGSKTFTVTATDAAGNTASTTHGYSVGTAPSRPTCTSSTS